MHPSSCWELDIYNASAEQLREHLGNRPPPPLSYRMAAVILSSSGALSHFRRLTASLTSEGR